MIIIDYGLLQENQLKTYLVNLLQKEKVLTKTILL